MKIIHKIKASSTSFRVIETLGTIDNLGLHSKFQSGVNYAYKKGLIFIGSGKSGVLPFGIHIDDKDILRIINDNTRSFKIDMTNMQLLSNNIIIDLNDSIRFNSKIPNFTNSIEKKSLVSLLELIVGFNIKTGFNFTIEELIDKNNEIGNFIYNSLSTRDGEQIRNNLMSIIGRGSGLTPSGDDLLIGLIWLNDVINIFNDEYKDELMDLIQNYKLTTDISINYFSAALSGHYSSRLIALCNSLYKFDTEKIILSLREIINWGHTSGIDTLAGIALGLNVYLK